MNTKFTGLDWESVKQKKVRVENFRIEDLEEPIIAKKIDGKLLLFTPNAIFSIEPIGSVKTQTKGYRAQPDRKGNKE